jgi:hypothetical protein
VALITLGEGWHNNHHHYPGSANQGFRWWEVDVSYCLIRLLALPVWSGTCAGTHRLSWANVGQEQHLLVRQVGFDLERVDVGERHPQVVGLAAGKAPEHVREAEPAGG